MQQVGRWLKRSEDTPDQATDINNQGNPTPEPKLRTGQYTSVTHGKLRIVPLGGLGEIGKNMMALEFGDDIIIVDAGVMFPQEDMPGVDLVIPNTDYLMENREKVHAILITHGHEDHTGAIPFVLPRLNVPVYAPRLARGLIEVKLKEHRLLGSSELHGIEPGQVFNFGVFQAEFFRVCHSIPDAMGIAIQTPIGLVVHTGDFKFDHTPVDKKPTDFARLTELGIEGVTLLLADSTYAEMEGYTPSEAVLDKTLERIIAEAPGRVMVATFASLIARIQQIANAADRSGRKVAVVGRSMVNNVAMAQQMGYLDVPDGVIVPWESLAALPMEKTVIIMTGAQGEPTSALSRVSTHDHRDINISVGDTIVFSASPIPGNEGMINKTIDNLLRQGTRVLHARNSQVHVHGHASEEELKLMLRMIKPRFFVPIHGEYRHLVAHAGIAFRMGVPEDRIFVMEDGDILELDDQEAGIVDRIPAGHIFVLGRRLWDPSSSVFKDRESLGREGIVVAALTLDAITGNLRGIPVVTSNGFRVPEDHEEIMAQAGQRVKEILSQQRWDQGEPEDALKQKASDVLGKFFRDKTGRRPVVLTIVSQV